MRGPPLRQSRVRLPGTGGGTDDQARGRAGMPLLPIMVGEPPEARKPRGGRSGLDRAASPAMWWTPGAGEQHWLAGRRTPALDDEP